MTKRWGAVLGTGLLLVSVSPAWGDPEVSIRGDARIRSLFRWNHDFNGSNGPAPNRRVSGDESFVDHRERLYINGKVGDDFETMFQWNIGNHELGGADTPPTDRPSVTDIGESVRQLWVDVRFPFPAPVDKWHLKVGRQFIGFGQGLVYGDRRNGTDSLWFYGPVGPGRLTLGFLQISEGDTFFNDDWRIYGTKYRLPVLKDHAVEPYFLYSLDRSNRAGSGRTGSCRQNTSPTAGLTSNGISLGGCQDTTNTWFLGATYEGRVGTPVGNLKLWLDGAYQGGEREFKAISGGSTLLEQDIRAWGALAGVELDFPRTWFGLPVSLGLEGGYGTGDKPRAAGASGLDESTMTHFGIMSPTIRFRDRFPGLSNYQFGNFTDEATAGNGPDTLTLGGGAADAPGSMRTRSATFNGVSNQYLAMFKLVVRPHEKLEFDLRGATHWAVEPESAATIANNFLTTAVPVRNPNGRPVDSHLGEDVGLVISWFMHKNVVLSSYFLWFFPGDYFKVEEAAGTRTRTPDVAQTIRFEIVGRF